MLYVKEETFLYNPFSSHDQIDNETMEVKFRKLYFSAFMKIIY